MASLVKRCRHRGADRETCGCTWYIRERTGGRDTYTPVGADRAAADRALRRHDAEPVETVSQTVDLWLATKTRARPNSLAVYRSRAKYVRAAVGHIPVKDLRPSDLTGLVQAMLDADYSPATVQGGYHVLTSALRHAQRRGVIRSLPLPAYGPGIPAPQPRDHRLTLPQVEQVIADMPGVWGRVAELILLTGLRWGEAVAIEVDDIDGAVVHVRRTRNRYGGTNAPKTKAGARVVPLSRRARAILRDLDLPVGGDYRASRLALVAAMGDLHQPGMGWHTIRNAHATLLDSSGVGLRDSAARMGHGHHYAQTLAYGLRSEAGSADALDKTRRRHARDASPSEGVAAPADLEEHRARRRRAAP